MLICLAGNICSGKTTLATAFSKSLNVALAPEDITKHEYLEKYYYDMEEYALRSQIRFLLMRSEALREVIGSQTIIQDRSIYEDFHVFGKAMKYWGLIKEDDWRLYEDLYRTISRQLPKPDLILYLSSDEADIIQRLDIRQEVGDAKISIEYVRELESRYQDWRETINIPVLDIDSSEIDFRSADGVEVVKSRVNAKLNCKIL